MYIWKYTYIYMEIAAYIKQNLLNKRNEIVSKCCNQLKYALARFDTRRVNRNHYIVIFPLAFVNLI